MKKGEQKKIEYKIGIFLLFLYIFTSYVAVDIIVPSLVNTIFLYVFLGWGLLVTLIHGINDKLPIYTCWYAIFMIVSFICMLYSPSVAILTGEFYLMIVSFLLTYLIQLFIKTEQDFKKLAWFYSISSLAMILMLQFTGNLSGSAEERLGGELVGNANTFAFIIMFAVLLQLWLLIYNSKGLLLKIVLFSMVIYNMYALALSAGRKFFLLPFGFVYLLLILKVNKKGKRNFILYTIICAIIAVVAFNMVMKIPILYESIGTRLESTMDKTDRTSDTYYSTMTREKMRNDAIEQWWRKPIFGYGFDSYKYRAREIIGHFYYSHCNFTEMLYNGGIIYFGVYYSIYFLILKQYFKKKKVNEKYRSFALAAALVFFVLDYGAVTYSVAAVQISLCLALKALTFEDAENLIGGVENEQIKNIG